MSHWFSIRTKDLFLACFTNTSSQSAQIILLKNKKNEMINKAFQKNM